MLELAQVTVANKDAHVGGGIFSQGSLVIRNSTIRGNAALGNEDLGGGLYQEQETALLERLVITGNRAEEYCD